MKHDFYIFHLLDFPFSYSLDAKNPKGLCEASYHFITLVFHIILNRKNSRIIFHPNQNRVHSKQINQTSMQEE